MDAFEVVRFIEFSRSCLKFSDLFKTFYPPFHQKPTRRLTSLKKQLHITEANMHLRTSQVNTWIYLKYFKLVFQGGSQSL